MKTLNFKYYLLALLALLALAPMVAQEEHAPGRSGDLQQTYVTLPFSSESQYLTVEIIDGLVILEGDIILGEADSYRPGRGGAATSKSATRWPKGVVPYVIQSGHPQKRRIQQAIAQMNADTNITLQPHSGETDYVEFMAVSSGCSSSVGRRGGRQYIRVSSDCKKGHIMHEIGHTVGLYHEHTRRDRDSRINVDTTNIKPTKLHNYKKYTTRIDYPQMGGMDVGSYDHGSIMHYPSGLGSSFAIDPSKPIITTIPPGKKIGQRKALSTRDKRTINFLYPSSVTGKDTDTSISSSSTDDSGAIDISYPMELIPQTTHISCWAAAASMIVGWREGLSMDPQDIARGLRGWRQYFYNGGLPPDNTEMFSVWGLHYDYPQSYTVQGFADLMAVGPLWVATDLGGDAHVVVVSSMRGDGTPQGTVLTIHDPWERGMTRYRPSNEGAVYEETYQEFVERQERLAVRELDEPLAFYIAY